MNNKTAQAILVIAAIVSILHDIAQLYFTIQDRKRLGQA